MTSALTLCPRSCRTGLAAALALVALMVGCGKQQSTIPAAQAVPLPGNGSPRPARGPVLADASNYFAIERALGAECDDRWISDPPLQDAACYGMLPEHVASFIRTIADDHPYLGAEQRVEVARTKQVFRAVQGYGERPDILASIEHSGTFWIRSFEGTDPEITVYAVYGPSCDDDPYMKRKSVEERCLSGAPYVMRELKIYRVRSGEAAEDVSGELLPIPPGLTPAEQGRYGIYLRPEAEGPAMDTDIGLDVTRLAQVPVMRWVLRPVQEGEHEPPAMPESDPRAFLDFDWRNHAAHFGFLVWTGEHFELRETVPADLWPCRSVQPGRHVCGAGYEGVVDRYLMPMVGMRSGGTET